MEFEGQLWAMQEDDELHLICTVKRNKKKVQLLNSKNREQTVGEDKLLWQLAVHARNADDWRDKAGALQTRIRELQAQVDVALLWETACDAGVDAMADLAELFFSGAVGVEHHIALWQALAADRLYFKRKGKTWEARAPAQVEELQKNRQAEQAREAFQTQALTWLAQFVQADVPPHGSVPAELAGAEALVARVECWMRGDKDKELQPLLEQTAEAAKILPRELGFDILQHAGLLPEDADRDIIVAGLKTEFSVPVTEAALAVAPWPAEDSGVAELELAFSIDDDDTREVDDALGVCQEGEWLRVDIAISDPARLVQRGDALDREAMRRGTTVYLPTRTVLMMPERISCDLASLSPEAVRSSVVVQAWFDADARLARTAIRRCTVRVAQRLSYVQADAWLRGEVATNDSAQAATLRQLHELAQRLTAQREAEHAINLQRPEFKIKVSQNTICVEMIERDSPSRLLVAEMMILANHAAARHARDHQVPIIYRTQDPPEQPIPKEWQADPLRFASVRKLLRPSALSLHPGGHSGLGLSAYTQLSSPLRRFADLVMQRQLVAHISGEALPYDHEELFKVLATAENTAREAKTLESAAKRRWFMEYLRREWMDTPVQALLVEETKAGFKAEIQPWGVDALISGGLGRLQPGVMAWAKIEKLRPKAGQIRLQWQGDIS